LKSIIVTGASSGIGKAAVIRLVQSGYQVFGLSRRYDQLLALSSELSSYNLKDDQYFPAIFDITRYDKFEEVLNNILSNSSEKTIFGLVNNAGYVEPGAIEDITIENLRAQFERFSNAYNKYLNNIPSGLSAKIVANVIDQAIRSSTPKHRYIIGSSKEKLALRLRPFIPNKLFYSQVAKRILS